jgi:hypothetical protein
MINEAFDQPKKIAAVTADGRRTYRYARDEQELAKKQDQLRKAGASSIRVEEVEYTTEEISSVSDRKARIAKGIYPKNEKGEPLTKHLMFHQYKKGPDGKHGLHKHDGLIKMAQDHAKANPKKMAESVDDYIEVKGGNMSKKEIEKLVAKRKKELGEDLSKSSDKLDLLRHLISKSR